MPGVAEMTANMLTQGTKKRSAKEIAEAIDFVGGSLEAAAGKDSTTVSLNVVKKDLATGLDLMSDVVLHPAFQADELERQRQQLLSNLTVQYSDPEYLASVVFGRVIYGNSPYGWPQEGTPATVNKFDRGRPRRNFTTRTMRRISRCWRSPGDITPEEAFAAAEKYFGGWPKIDVASAVPPQRVAGGRAAHLADRQAGRGANADSRRQAGHPAQRSELHSGGGDEPDFRRRLQQPAEYRSAREERAHLRRVFFVQSASVTRIVRRGNVYADGRDGAGDEAGGGSADENVQWRHHARRSWISRAITLPACIRFNRKRRNRWPDRILTVADFDLPADYNSTYPDRIRGVTPEQVKQMAQRYLQTKDLDIVLAGNVGAFRDALKKEFPNATYKEIPFDQVDVMASDLRRAKAASAVAAGQ